MEPALFFRVLLNLLNLLLFAPDCSIDVSLAGTRSYRPASGEPRLCTYCTLPCTQPLNEQHRQRGKIASEAVSTIMPARSCRRDVAGRKQHPVAKVAHSTWNPALPSSSARESLAFKLSGPKRAGGRGESKDSRSARGVFARMSRQYLRLGRSVNRQVDAVEALQAPVAGDKCRQKRAREMRSGRVSSEVNLREYAPYAIWVVLRALRRSLSRS